MEVIIGAGILAALYFLSKQTAAPTGTTTPPLPSAVASPIIQSNALVSGGYQLTPDGSLLGSINGVQQAAVSQSGLPSIPPPTTLPPPPPYVVGGLAGSIGSGGNPFGGVLRPGVSSGSSTTSLPTPTFANITAAQAGQLAARGYTVVGSNAYAPGAPVPIQTRWSGVTVIA